MTADGAFHGDGLSGPRLRRGLSGLIVSALVCSSQFRSGSALGELLERGAGGGALTGRPCDRPCSMNGKPKQLLLGWLVAIEVVSAALAWRDLSRRGDDQVRGHKKAWRAAMLLNPGNSVLYWAFGRR
jgi:hypothetical protein